MQKKMTPQQFIQKWKDNPLKERASYPLHFIDLCALMGVPTPSPATAETYCFERGATAAEPDFQVPAFLSAAFRFSGWRARLGAYPDWLFQQLCQVRQADCVK